VPNLTRRCTHCRRGADPEYIVCARCRERGRLTNRARYHRRRAQGRCGRCERPALPERSQCARHAQRHAQAQWRYRERRS
jgi:hypothetical protein